MTHFTDLSEDVLLLIAGQIEHERDFSCLVRTTRALYGLLNGKLYSDNVCFHDNWALTWAAHYNRVDTAERLLVGGAPPSPRGP